MTTDNTIIFCTCPDNDTAQSLARLLVTRKLAACVNILPAISSVYRWQGQIETADEWLLLIKAAADNYQAIETVIRHHHPYELPEIIAIPIVCGLPDYLHWMNTCHLSN